MNLTYLSILLRMAISPNSNGVKSQSQTLKSLRLKLDTNSMKVECQKGNIEKRNSFTQVCSLLVVTMT